VSGLYKVIDGNSNQTFQVFCDFDSEPGFAWNLIQSFSLSNKDIFQVNAVNVREEWGGVINCHMTYSNIHWITDIFTFLYVISSLLNSN